MVQEGPCCCKIIQKWDKSLVESSSGGSQQVESARGGADRGGAAGSPVKAGGNSERNPFPEVLDLTTPLLLHFLCFLMLSTAERRLSNENSKDWGSQTFLLLPL